MHLRPPAGVVWVQGMEKHVFQLTLKSRPKVKVKVTSNKRTRDLLQVLCGIRGTKKHLFLFTLKSRSKAKVKVTSEKRTPDL
jgi:hypothetical protein